MGIMTSYGSYNDIDKPIIADCLIITLGNSTVSFFAGFTVFCVVGYLKTINSPVTGAGGGMGLAFVAYPTALSLLPGKNVWSVLLFLTLFTLGIDSAFGMYEACATVVYDTPWAKGKNRVLIAFGMCVAGALASVPFCFDFGLILLDAVDHYLASYLMILIGVL